MRRVLKFILALSLLTSPCLIAQAQSLTRGPYLQMGSTTAVTVKWRTGSSTDSVVRYGTSASSLTQTKSSSTATTTHEVRLTGLSPDTKYYYSVGSSSTTLASGSGYFFVTAPTGAKPTRIWAIGDAGTADSSQRAVRDAYYNFTGTRHTDLWLMLGDNAYSDGTDSEYQSAVFDIYPTMLRQSVVWPTMGNHDGHSATSSSQSGPYYSIFSLPKNAEAGGVSSGTEAYYSFDYGNIHLICLDSEGSSRSTSGAMLNWLRNDLANTTKDWIIAYWHHPPYSKGSHDSDSESELREMRQNALPILEAGGVDLVLGGHSHSYERSYLLDGHYGSSSSLTSSMKVDGGNGRENGNGAYTKPGSAGNEGAVYIVAGSSGKTSGGSLDHPAMFISLDQLGSVVLDISGNRLDAKFVRSTGATADYFTIIKGSSTPTPPSAPTGLAAVAGNGQVSLNWAATTGATSYKVKRATTSGGAYTTIATPTTPTYANTGLANGTTYYYAVSAVNSVGESANSSQVNSTPTSTLPYEAESATLSGAVVASNQTGYSGTGFADYVNATGDYVQWTVNAAAAGTYALEFRYANGATNDRPLELKVNGAVVSSSRSFPPSGGWGTWKLATNNAVLVAGNNTIRLTANGSNGPNLDCLRLWAGAPALPALPGVPAGLAAGPGNGQVSLNWTASSGASSYNVKRSSTTGGPYTTIAATATPSYLNTGLLNGTTYYYVVSAVNAAGQSANSSQVSATPASTPTPTVPGVPTGLAAAAGNSQVALNWTASTGATTYKVKRATTSGGPYTTIATPATPAYLNTGLANGTTYYYAVSAVNSIGESSNSSQVNATPTGTLPYEAENAVLAGAVVANNQPGYSGTGFADYVNSTGDYVQWKVAAASAGTYALEFRYANGGTTNRPLELKVNGKVVSSSRSFPPTGGWGAWTLTTNNAVLVSGNNTIRLTATGANGPNMDCLRVWSAAAPTLPGVPTGLTAVAGNAQVTLNWIASVGAASYNIKRSTSSSGPFTTIGTAATPTYVNTGLANGTTYYYVVSAVNAAGQSVNSSPVNATPGSAVNLIYEAENAVLFRVEVKNNRPGYSGTGFAHYVNKPGEYIEWNINAVSPGTQKLEFRYSNGDRNNHPLELKVNGAVVNSSLGFPPTGGWSQWTIVSQNAALAAGNNTIRLTDIGSNGGNIDYLRIGTTQPPAPIRVTIGLNSSRQPQISWTSTPGKTYRVACKNKLTDTNWIDASGNITATANSTSWTDTTASSLKACYYVVYTVN